MSESIKNQIIDGTITRREIVEIINKREREVADLERQLQEANERIKNLENYNPEYLTVEILRAELLQLRQEKEELVESHITADMDKVKLINTLRADLESETKWAKEYHDELQHSMSENIRLTKRKDELLRDTLILMLEHFDCTEGDDCSFIVDAKEVDLIDRIRKEIENV